MPPAVIPKEFVDDGCSSWLDRWFGYDCSDCCRHHDWESCSRVHPAGSMTEARKVRRAVELGHCVSGVLPWCLDWTVGLAYRVVAAWPGYWDTCGYDAGELCRHGMPRPQWMIDLHESGGDSNEDDY